MSLWFRWNPHCRIRYQSSAGASTTDLGLGIAILYHLSPPSDRRTFFLGFGPGLRFIDAANAADTQFSVSMVAGMKFPLAGDLGMLTEAFFLHGFETDQQFAFNGLGLDVGISFFTGG